MGRRSIVVVIVTVVLFLTSDIVTVVAALLHDQSWRPAVRVVLPVPARHVPDRGRHVARLDHPERAAIGVRAIPIAVVPDEPVDAVTEQVVLAIVVVHTVHG